MLQFLLGYYLVATLGTSIISRQMLSGCTHKRAIKIQESVANIKYSLMAGFFVFPLLLIIFLILQFAVWSGQRTWEEFGYMLDEKINENEINNEDEDEDGQVHD
jgi:hypothetical protein